jgi:hypothetical protein
MRIDAGVAVIALARDQSLRLEPGVHVEIDCAAGVLWITEEGDLRDLFLAHGESLELAPLGTAMVTALEPARVGVTDLRRHRMRGKALGAWALRCAQLLRKLLGTPGLRAGSPAGLTVRR